MCFVCIMVQHATTEWKVFCESRQSFYPPPASWAQRESALVIFTLVHMSHWLVSWVRVPLFVFGP